MEDIVYKMSYNLRPTSFVGAHLDNELAKRGAHTSGSTARKQERLRRFKEADEPAVVYAAPARIAPAPAPAVARNVVRNTVAPAAPAAAHTYNTRARTSAKAMVGVRSLLRDYIGY